MLVEASGGWLVTEKVIVSLFLSVAVSFTTTVLPTVASITDEAFTNCGGKFSVEKIRNLTMVHITSPQRNRVLDKKNVVLCQSVLLINISLIFEFFKCLPFRVFLDYSSETWMYYYF